MAARKLGLIAGGGDLPLTLAARCEAAGRSLYVIRLRGFAGGGFERFEGADCGLGEFGRCFDLLRAAGCEAVCFAGHVAKPDFAKLKPDLRGVRLLPGLIAAAVKGDDGLLRAILKAFEDEGFLIEGADDVDSSLMLPAGALGAISPGAEHHDDIVRAMSIARAAGALDIGQGAVIAGGVVLAVEAQEGTDAMLRRCADLPAALRGARDRPLGVLAKAPKPIQERRVDLPTLGPATIAAAAEAGLAGVVGEAGGVLVLDRKAVIAAAERLGLFVWGAPPP